MQKGKWEDTLCFVCDYWWLILLILFLALAAAFTSKIWLSLLGFTDDPRTEQPVPSAAAWKSFNDPEMGYSIQYPSEWEASLPEIKQQNGFTESVILADQKELTPQTRQPNEKARVWIVSYPKEGVPLQTWVMTHWNWLDGQMVESTLNGFQALKAKVNPVESTFTHNLLWVERENDILCFWAQTDAEFPQNEITVQKMFDLITFSR